MTRDRQVDDASWQARVELAACYRLVHHFDFADLGYTHITARIPGRAGHFLLNPFGYLFDEITASSLVEVDADGNVLADATGSGINRAGFVIHSAIHQARPDVACVVHTHTPAGMAVAAQTDGLLPITQHAMRFAGQIGYHDYEGISLSMGERPRLARDLGSFNAMVLRNYGLLTAGRTTGRGLCLDVLPGASVPSPSVGVHARYVYSAGRGRRSRGDNFRRWVSLHCARLGRIAEAGRPRCAGTCPLITPSATPTKGIQMNLTRRMASLVLLVAAALGSVQAQTPATKVRVGLLPIYDTLPLYVGRDQGFFKEEGIDLELIPSPGGPAAIAAMEGGSLDFAYSGLSTVYNVTEQGMNVRIVAPAGTVSLRQERDGARFWVSQASGIKTLAELKGKKVATNQFRNVVHLYILAALDEAGLPPNSYSVVEVPYPQMPDALFNTQVDAIYEVDPFNIALEESGKARDLGSASFKVHPNMRIAGYIATQKWLDTNADVARRFQRAYAKSARHVSQNMDKQGEWNIKYFRLKPEWKDKVTPALFPDVDLSSDFVASMEKTKALMLKYGFLKKNLDTNALLFK